MTACRSAQERILDRAFARLAAASDVVHGRRRGRLARADLRVATMADIAASWRCRSFSSSGMRLGCLNHALLTREAIRSYGLPFAGWIANKMHGEMALAGANIDTSREPVRSRATGNRAGGTDPGVRSEAAPRGRSKWQISS